MGKFHLTLFLVYACAFSSSYARHHKHSFKRHKHGHHYSPPSSGISLPPSPQPDDPPAGAPVYAPSGFFDVRSFGAVGDGVVDDTEAFKAAWDAACSSADNSALLAPSGHTFMVQSTIFTGPCQSELVFQVLLFTLFSMSRLRYRGFV